MAEKTSMYHSELASLGDVTVDVLSDVLPSKFKKGTFFVSIGVDGRRRDLNIENDAVQAELENRKGQRLLLVATGSREQAQIEVLEAGWTPQGEQPAPQVQPAQRQPARQQPGRNNPPRNTPEPAQPRNAPARPAPPARQQSTGMREVHNPQTKHQTPNPQLNAAAMLFRLANLEIKIQTTVQVVCEELKTKRGIELSEHERGGMVGRFFIQMARDNYLGVMPNNRLIDCSRQQQEQAPATPEQPAEPSAEPSDNDGAA